MVEPCGTANLMYDLHVFTVSEMKALEIKMEAGAEEIDSEVVEMMGRFEELTEVEREKVLEQLDGVLSEKVCVHSPSSP